MAGDPFPIIPINYTMNDSSMSIGDAASDLLKRFAENNYTVDPVWTKPWTKPIITGERFEHVENEVQRLLLMVEELQKKVLAADSDTKSIEHVEKTMADVKAGKLPKPVVYDLKKVVDDYIIGHAMSKRP